ncbi:peptidase C69, partial [Thiococcus pfennigii]|nr:peptidase C69 [Thiococcus pfennigii]
MNGFEEIAARFAAQAPAADYWTLRLVAEEGDALAVRQGVPEPSRLTATSVTMAPQLAVSRLGSGTPW